MINKSGRAGKSTRYMASKRHKSAIWIGLIGIALILIVSYFLLNSKLLGIGGLGIFGLIFLIQILSNITKGRMSSKLKEEKRAIRGARSEERIGELLSDLSDDYFVLNDIESPFGNIDHIVISKNSEIYLIETKAHGGKVELDGDTLLVNGKLPEKNFISQALQNAYWLRDEIGQIVGSKPWITPIIVFTNAFVIPMRPIKGVNVINKKYLTNVLYRKNKPNASNTQIWEHKETIEKRLL